MNLPLVVPAVLSLPGPERVGRDKTANRADIRAAVIADLSDEMRAVLGIERAFIVAARPPQVLFRRPRPDIRGRMCGEDGRHVRRTGHERAMRVHAVHHLRQHLPAEAVVLRRQAVVDIHAVDFVVAAPDGEAGVVAQPYGHGLSLCAHLGQEVLRLRIARAGEREVLPDQDALLVAEVEEAVALVCIAAPAAHHVAADVIEQRNGAVDPFGVAAVEGVERHPVRALDHDRLAVDVDDEMAGRVRRAVMASHGGRRSLRRPHLPGRLRAVHRYRADADAVGPFSQHRAPATELRGHRVQVRCAIPARPPEPRTGHGDAAAACQELRRPLELEAVLAACALETQAEAVHVCNVCPELPARAEGRAAEMRLDRPEIELFDGGRRTCLEIDGPPDARGDRARQDVPAPDVGSLAEEQPFLAEIRAGAGRVVAEPARVVECGAEAHGDPVPPRPQRGGDSEAVADEHVGGAADLVPVHPDGRQRVQPLAHEVPLLPRGVGRQLELAGIPPLVCFIAAEQANVCGVVGIGQGPRAFEIQLDVARHSGRDNRYIGKVRAAEKVNGRGGGGGRFREAGKLPVAVEVDAMGHSVSPVMGWERADTRVFYHTAL